MKKIYLLTIISLLIISCEKESGPTEINGSVKDKTTNAGIENADVGLFESDGENSWGLGGVLIDEIYSDADGNFTFDFEARKGYSYYVYAIKDQYWNIDGDNITFVDNTGGETDVTVFLQPEGWLSIHFKNIPPTSIYDNFDINGYVTDGFNGEDVDTIVLYKVYGNINNILYWALYGEMTSTDTLYCSAFDTTYFEIFY
ncbi:MAG: hypothetical protein IPG60_14155 [Bacteroidetes bacterium]|nr:hypothetical protein [Bacteroidota bacterium]MBK8487039.1 hypothetical protein [Bacteroidota bacterium]MBK8680427.1 hypothetical protein [Bacteroidota bacterium]